MWKLLEKDFRAICINFSDGNVCDKKYLFACGSNKKCPEFNNADSLVFFCPYEIKIQESRIL